MGKLAVKKFTALMFLIVQITVSIYTFVGLFGGDSNPAHSTASAMTVYVLPLLIISNAVLLIYWLILRKWYWAAIPIVTLLCCIPYCGTLVQLRSLPEDNGEQAGITIATYNVAMFGREINGFISQDILTEMKNQHVDVLCLQEYMETSGNKKNSESYKEYFPYMSKGKDDMVIFSRYPIVESKNFPFEMTNNSAHWAVIDINGIRLRVYNVHLETTGINRTLHVASKALATGIDIDNNRLVKYVFGNYMLGMIARSGQANQMAMDIRSSNYPVIVCGDFNDVPYSYVYNTMLGNLIDGFKECGSGWMYTFRGGRKSVRIDYIFHDKSLKGIQYYKRDLSYSDHNPVFMKLGLDEQED